MPVMRAPSLLRLYSFCQKYSWCLPVRILSSSCSISPPSLRNTEKAKKFFNEFRVGGHRGAPLAAPENTMESFQEALSSKMDLLEFDLALSKDGEVVIMHDDDLLRTCGVSGNVCAFTLEELKTMNAGHAFYKDGKICRIPTLKEVVKFCHDNHVKMLFDVKDWSATMVSQIVSTIRDNDLYDEVIVSSFFPWVSYSVKKADPKILTGLKHYAASLLDVVNMKALDAYLPAFLGVEMMLTHEKEISGSFVDLMSHMGVQVVAWTVNDKSQMLFYRNSLKVPFLTDDPSLYSELERAQKALESGSR